MQHTHFTRENYDTLNALMIFMDFDSYETADELRDAMAETQKCGDMGAELADEICFPGEPPNPIFSLVRYTDKSDEADLVERLIALYKTPREIIPGLRETTKECGECKKAYDDYLTFCVESSAMGDGALTDEFLDKLRSLGGEEYSANRKERKDERGGEYNFRDYDFLGVYKKEEKKIKN